MKTTVKSLKERIRAEKEDIINLSIPKDNIFGDNKEGMMVQGLLEYVRDETDLESYIWEEVANFVDKNISVEDIFSVRYENPLEDKISEVLMERSNTLDGSEVSNIDNIFESAGFRYMLMIANNIEESLLKVYILDNLDYNISKMDDDLELDASEYDTYEDEEDLLDCFIAELISSISGNTQIIQIEDNYKEALSDFFGI